MSLLRSLQSFSWLGRRRGRTAFWLLGRRRLVAAVLEPTTDEPLLVACATLVLDEAPSCLDFAPGLLETASAAGALSVPHVAALDEEWCRLTAGDGRADTHGFEGEARTIRVDVRGHDDLRVIAAPSAIARTAERFSSAGLRLVALDCADCALLSLATYLGRSTGADVASAIEEARALDPLTAISVSPECEGAAAHAADALAVPVGLALERFGLTDHA